MVIKRSYMLVTTVFLLRIGIAAFADPPLFGTTGGADLSEVIRADLVWHSPLAIMPCHQVNAIIRLTVERPMTVREWIKLTRCVSETVRVNGRTFRNRLSDGGAMNDAASFRFLHATAPTRDGGPHAPSKTAELLVSLFLNGEDRDCLFVEPGRYHVEFIIGSNTLAVEIDVQQPTSEERTVINAIRDLPVLLFLLDPADSQYATDKTVAIIEGAAQKETRYTKFLYLARGIAKAKAPSTFRPSDPDYAQRRRAWLQSTYAWLNPYCRGDITSALEATAAFQCGVIAGMLAHNEANEKAAREYRARQKELWGKVAESRLAIGDAARVKEYLARLVDETPAPK